MLGVLIWKLGGPVTLDGTQDIDEVGVWLTTETGYHVRCSLSHQATTCNTYSTKRQWRWSWVVNYDSELVLVLCVLYGLHPVYGEFDNQDQTSVLGKVREIMMG